MSLSRVESRKQQQEHVKNKKKKRNVITMIQLCLLALILLALAILFQGDRMMGWFNSVSDHVTGDERIIHNVPANNGTEQKPDTTNSLQENDELGLVTDGQEENTANDLIEGEGSALSPSAPETTEHASEVPATSEAVEWQTVQLAFVGDLLLGEYIDAYLRQEGVDYPFEQALFHLTSADITAGNLEMPITTADDPQDKTYVFKGEPESLTGLVNAGFDVVSLANNHTLDHGVTGMLDTMKHLDDYGVAHIGAGNNADEAYAPFIQEVNGIKVAYVATSRVLPETTWKANKYDAGLAESYDPTQTLESIAALEDTAHLTIVLVHWGEERADNPNEHQLSLAKKYIDAGADLVVGSHPHVLQGFEQYKGKWIAYSLGNFVFSSHPKGRQAETGVLTATCSAEAACELQLAPMKIVNAQPTPIEGEAAKELLSFLQGISIGNVRIDDRGNISSGH